MLINEIDKGVPVVPRNVRKVQQDEFERIRNEIANATHSLLQKNAKLNDAISSK